MSFTSDDLHDIQGVGIGGFKKDQQELLFVRFGDQASARELLTALAPRVANAWEVGRFNELFSEVRSRSHEGSLRATWVGAMVSAAGYRVLGVDLGAELGTSDTAVAFGAGMAARAQEIGDTHTADAPASWLAELQAGAAVHLLIVIAADLEADLNDAVSEVGDLVSTCRSTIIFQERGRVLPAPLTGHEHFGFKDGISQPALEDYDPPPAANEPAAVKAGEFVVGFPDETGLTAPYGSLWQRGSFAVFRRLRQNVAAFRALAAAGVAGAAPALAEGELAAKLVGRWPSGASLELFSGADPGDGNATNNYQYAAAPFSDDEGRVVPRWAHIRKANPRDETRPDPADAVSRHRMIRRGSPYGRPLADGAGDDGADRGLHFICVVADLVRQFEFVQRRWLQDPNFPTGQAPAPGQSGYGPPPAGVPGDGPDPLGEHDDGAQCVLHQASGAHPFPLAGELVTMTGGEYFFVPSIACLGALGGGTTTSTGAVAAASPVRAVAAPPTAVAP